MYYYAILAGIAWSSTSLVNGSQLAAATVDSHGPEMVRRSSHRPSEGSLMVLEESRGKSAGLNCQQKETQCYWTRGVDLAYLDGMPTACPGGWVVQNYKMHNCEPWQQTKKSKIVYTCCDVNGQIEKRGAEWARHVYGHEKKGEREAEARRVNALIEKRGAEWARRVYDSERKAAREKEVKRVNAEFAKVEAEIKNLTSTLATAQNNIFELKSNSASRVIARAAVMLVILNLGCR
eukprot:CAMPEP_0197704214 /NCGR_PEP_ID=MMETSP1338-20131121/125827_1 /TAXON_ID=43686 ORGANISM="Pelagodinium beii, Strain RCC1491" /NCGR_SAMPLE_ID=MMETSP1338 /ASSEMBLY_ACC=CAM_ASM_000754 /LENGTH=234 /DNA_ID=CAMNT_0043288113 /DNA_START=1 /DNA_END=705 /DNA_ORIENTATION=+